MAVLVIEHPEGGSPGNFAEIAELMHRPLTRVLSGRDQLPDPDTFSALVMMGGLENVDEQERYPYLADEIDYLRRWSNSDKPFLGVCLGAQLLALALGGEAERMAEPEIGWHRFWHESDAGLDPVLAAVADQVAMQWHSYTARPPATARILARNDYGVQAFRQGHCWGVQFHPEGNRETLNRWTTKLDGDGQHAKAAELEAGAVEHGRRWRRYGSELFGRFLALSQ